MLLGYRVDWPVNIIITQDALRTYAEIFSYLIRVRLAVVSLTDVWNWLKVFFVNTRILHEQIAILFLPALILGWCIYCNTQ